MPPVPPATQPQSIELGAGERAPEDGVFYPTSSHEALRTILMDRRHRYELAEARVKSLQATVDVITEELNLKELQLRRADLQTDIERLKAPGFLERHLGWSAGVGACYSESEVEACGAVLWGFKF